MSLFSFPPENLVSRDEFDSPTPRKPAHLHTRSEPGAYLRDSSRVPRRRSHINVKPPYAIGSAPSLSGRESASTGPVNLEGSSERMLPWQVTMDQLICASLSHTHHHWYAGGMWKIPAISFGGSVGVARIGVIHGAPG